MLRTAIILSLSYSLILSHLSSANAFKLPDSGQNSCYDLSGSVIDCTGTGQDGAYSINPMSLTDNGNGTVTDNNTALMWQKEDDNQTYNWYRASGTSHATYNPSPSQDVCGSLTLGDHDDWRLPSKKELMSIPDHSIGMPDPSINPTYFPGTETSAYYWTGTAYLGSSGSAWAVTFAGGNTNFGDKGVGLYVRCVRGGQATSSLIDNGDGTISDIWTGLKWQQGEPGQRNWSEALSYCEGLSLGDETDWRLPNIKELVYLTNDSNITPAIDTSYFPNAMSSCYWSSTSTSFDESTTLYVNFNGGNSSYTGKGSSCYLRCVRGGQGGSLGSLLIGFSGTGGGSVTGSGTRVGGAATFSTNTGTTEYFDVGTIVNLHAAPTEFSMFSGWTGACSGPSDCALTMTASADVTAGFDFDTDHKTKIYGTSSYYSTLQAAYDSPASSSSTIMAWEALFIETLTCNQAKNVALKGGYNGGFTANNGYTTLQGNLTVRYGSLVLERVVIR